MRSFILCLLVVAFSASARGQDFHTNPACWSAPRIYHAGAPSDALARKIERTANVTRAPRDNAVISPNGGYKAWVEIPNDPVGNIADQILYVSSEQDRVTRFYIEQAQLRVTPNWINEKLVFTRVRWGRTVFTDIIIDAESGALIFNEEARDGLIAYQQFQQACGGSCPCNPDAIDAIDPPVSKPAPGEVIGHAQINQILNHDLNPSVAPRPTVQRKPLPVYLDVNGSMQEITQITEPDGIVTDRSEEWKSALVFGRRAGWYQIKLSGDGERLVWVKEADVQSFTSMPEILRYSLAYLNENWDGRVWATPNGSGGFTSSPLYEPGLEQVEIAAEFTEVRETEGGIWLKVTLHDTDDCLRSDATRIDEGWVPAWSASGQLVGGYFARGC